MSNRNQNLMYAALALIFTTLSFVILQSFLWGILWGAVTALSCWPVAEWLKSKNLPVLRQSSSRISIAILTLFAALVIAPLSLGALQVYEAYTKSESYVATHNHGKIEFPPFLEQIPHSHKLKPYWAKHVENSKSVTEVLNSVSKGKLFEWFSVVWTEFIDKSFTFVVMCVSCFFMLKHGALLKQKYVTTVAYWVGPKAVVAIDNGLKGLRGTINGVVLIGIAEGVILSIPLMLGGMSSGFLVALTAGILGVIPMLMPALMLPCLGYLYLEGQHMWAVVGLIDLAIVWLVFENVVKPTIISQSIKINTFVILMAMIGGLQALGPVGLFLGPAVLAMAIGLFNDVIINHNV